MIIWSLLCGIKASIRIGKESAMNIKRYDKTSRDLLGSKRQFFIPRFQREYSWEKKNYQEFFEDMMGNLEIENGKISASQYFLGTMLFIGNFTEGTEQVIHVVDGQQRLTTITILFSALSDRFNVLKQPTLSRQMFKYIMTEDDDGNEVRILKSKTNYPYFAFFIQDKEKLVKREANTEEERCIKETYDYFHAQLRDDKLKAILKRKHGSALVDTLSEVDILKALRDQVLNSTFVSISTTDRDQANNIFEILNAKGKRLAHIDLIKNKLFEILRKEEPADLAEESWKQLKEILYSGKEQVGLATYYRHFWISKYNKSSSNRLYDDFISTISESEPVYTQFLADLISNAKLYMQIINPKREDYQNRKEYFGIVQSFNTLNNFFNIVQVRVALLALMDVKTRGIIDLTTLKAAIEHIENFHFAYTAVLSSPANKLEKIYSAFAIAIRKCENKADAKEVIRTKLYEPLDRLFPSYHEFSQKFVELSFSKSESPSNVKTKYAINKLNCYFCKKEVFPDDGSIEHIISENEGDFALNIGNLILLEQSLNGEAGHAAYSQKITIYKKSDYMWVEKFVDEHEEWDQAMIRTRAEELAKLYYQKIFKKAIVEGAS